MTKAQAEELKQHLTFKEYRRQKGSRTEDYGFNKVHFYRDNHELQIDVLFYETGESQVGISFNAT